MKVHYQLASLILALSFLPAHSHAIIVDGYFTGAVTNVRDEGDWNYNYLNFFSENISNQTVSGSFWYDTDLAPIPELPGSPYSYNTPISPVKWFDLTLSVDGKSLSISDDHPPGYETYSRGDLLVITDDHFPPNLRIGDQLHIVSSNGATNPKSVQSYYSATLSVRDPNIDFIHGTGLIQDFSWSRSGQGESGRGSYVAQSSQDGQLFSVNLDFELSTLKISPRAVSVPEPSSLILFGLGLLGLASRYRRLKLF